MPTNYQMCKLFAEEIVDHCHCGVAIQSLRNQFSIPLSVSDLRLDEWMIKNKCKPETWWGDDVGGMVKYRMKKYIIETLLDAVKSVSSYIEKGVKITSLHLGKINYGKLKENLDDAFHNPTILYYAEVPKDHECWCKEKGVLCGPYYYLEQIKSDFTALDDDKLI
jgi:hypothetical protein